jgi:hypothetical protein
MAGHGAGGPDTVTTDPVRNHRLGSTAQPGALIVSRVNPVPGTKPVPRARSCPKGTAPPFPLPHRHGCGRICRSPAPRSPGAPSITQSAPDLPLLGRTAIKRKTFDILVGATGLFLAVMLIVSGALLTWAHDFIGNEVHTQLAAQQIFFPPANSKAVAAPEFAAMRQYGGQQLTTGAQAEVYADHFIANHLKVIGGGKTYAQLSTEALAQPTNTKLAVQVATVFKGETLRGLLLNAYAFGTIGMIAGIAAIAAFIAAAVMLILGGLGLMHARRTSPDTDMLTGHPGPGDNAAHNGHSAESPLVTTPAGPEA